MIYFSLLLGWAVAVELNDRDRNDYIAKPLGAVCKTDGKRTQKLVMTVQLCREGTMEVQKSCYGMPTSQCKSEYDGDVYEINSDSYPMGCFVKGDRRYFNVNAANWGNSKARPVCKVDDNVTYTAVTSGPGGAAYVNSGVWPKMIERYFGTDSSLIECDERCIGTNWNSCYPINCHPKPASYSMNFDSVLKRNVEVDNQGTADDYFWVGAAAGASAMGLTGLVVFAITKISKAADSYDEQV